MLTMQLNFDNTVVNFDDEGGIFPKKTLVVKLY
jgi:hypothetical protein